MEKGTKVIIVCRSTVGEGIGSSILGYCGGCVVAMRRDKKTLTN